MIKDVNEIATNIIEQDPDLNNNERIKKIIKKVNSSNISLG